MAGSKTCPQQQLQLQQHLERCHLWVKRRHYQAAEAQPGTLVRPVFGDGHEVGTGAVWEFASGAAAPAGAESADKLRAGEGQTDGGVNSGAPVTLEPVVSVVPVTGGWKGSPRMCTVRVPPQAKWQRWREPGRSEAPPETNLLEPPV